MRTFISIDIPEKVRKEISKIQEQLPEFYGKKTEQENLHLTLKFLGEIGEEKIKEVGKRLKEIKLKSFETEIDSIGVFSERFVRIVWLHLRECEGLQKKVDDSLKDLFKPEKRFMSHLTIARVKSLEDKKDFLKKLGEIKLPELKFNVREFKLKKSVLNRGGPVYETLEKYKLVEKNIV